MYEIPKALEKLCVKFGVDIKYNSEVKRVCRHNGRINVVTGTSDSYVDAVIINADYAYARQSLLGENIRDYEYSCSVYLLYLGLKKKVTGLEHHNLFFPRDLQENLKEIFKEGTPSKDPSFYVHVPTVTDSSLAPVGKDIAYILVPVPNLKSKQYDKSLLDDDIRKTVFDKIKDRTGVDLEELIEVEHRFYPQDFIERYNINHGATFGLAHTLFQSAFFRPSNKSRSVKDVYSVGASTQPGGGLPPVLASSRIVSDLIIGGNTT